MTKASERVHTDDASRVGAFMTAHIEETKRDWEDVEGEFEALLDDVRADEREKCAALLGAEVLRLLGCRDREDAEGIARAASLIRAAAPPNGDAGPKETP